MYENALAGIFFYLWGAHDQQLFRTGKSGLLLNAQSPLDNVIGDLVGSSSSDRWFFAELKRTKSGFPAEISSKPHRAAFLTSVAAVADLTRISSRAHFAIWGSKNGLRFNEYAPTAKPAAFMPTNANLMRNRPFGFQDFYYELNIRSKRRHPLEAFIFSHGLGVPAEAMLLYMRHMIEFHKESKNPSEEALYIFAKVTPTSAITFFCGNSFAGLWFEIEKMKRLVRSDAPRP